MQSPPTGSTPGEQLKMHQHLGVELLYVISGSLETPIGSDVRTLHSGDAIYFDSAVHRKYQR